MSSFLGFGGNSAQPSSQAKIDAASAELDMVTTMFNQLVSSCHAKCLDLSYSNGELSQKESLCVDNCVKKYFDANVQVGENMQAVGKSGTLRKF